MCENQKPRRRNTDPLRIIDEPMMHAMAGAPDQHAVLQRHGPEEKKTSLSGRMSIVGAVRKQTVIAAGDRQLVCTEHHRKPHPGGSGVAMAEAIPRDEHEGERRCHREHQDNRPIARRGLPVSFSHFLVLGDGVIVWTTDIGLQFRPALRRRPFDGCRQPKQSSDKRPAAGRQNLR